MVNVVQPSGAEAGFVSSANVEQNGVTMEFSSNRVFVGGRMYNWTAYFWEDNA